MGTDEDQLWLLKTMKEKPPGTILEVGAQESYLAYILSRRGWEYFGSDLRGQLQTYEDTLDKAFDVNCLGKYTHLQGDFMTLKANGYVDIVISLSTIEHMGLQTYGELVDDRNYDAKAVKKIWDILKPGGVFYVTVPFGHDFIIGRLDGMYKEHPADKWEWRVYDKLALQTRIIQNFRVDSIEYFFTTPAITGHKKGEIVSEEVASSVTLLPDLSVAMRLVKDLDYHSQTVNKVTYPIEVPLQVELAEKQ